MILLYDILLLHQLKKFKQNLHGDIFQRNTVATFYDKEQNTQLEALYYYSLSRNNIKRYALKNFKLEVKSNKQCTRIDSIWISCWT